MPPTVRRRRRNAESRRGSPHAHPPFDRLNQRKTASQSELGVTVKHHPGPSLGRESSQTNSLKGDPDDLSAVHNVCRRDI